jgi:hypothetical protein
MSSRRVHFANSWILLNLSSKPALKNQSGLRMTQTVWCQWIWIFMSISILYCLLDILVCKQQIRCPLTRSTLTVVWTTDPRISDPISERSVSKDPSPQTAYAFEGMQMLFALRFCIMTVAVAVWHLSLGLLVLTDIRMAKSIERHISYRILRLHC